jgi:Ca2+-binding EF-hand superfamily protein
MHFHETFRVFDRNGDGSLTLEEWQRAARILAPELTRDGVEAIFRKFDTDGDGLMSLAEFFHFFNVSVAHVDSDGPRPVPLAQATEQHIGTPQFQAPLIQPLAPHIQSTEVSPSVAVFPSVYESMSHAPHIQEFHSLQVAREPTQSAVVQVTEHCASSQQSQASLIQPLAPHIQHLSSLPSAAPAPMTHESLPNVPYIQPLHSASHEPQPLTVCTSNVVPPIQVAGANLREPLHFGTQPPTLLTNRAPFQEVVAKKHRHVEEAWEKEVLNTISSCLSYPRSGFRIQEVFHRLDTSKSGFMDPYEFDRMATAYFPELQAAQLEKLFATVNVSGSGKITFDEFSRRFAC